MARLRLDSLFEALRGKPSEPEAVKVIAVFASIPAVVAGIFLGVAFVPQAAGFGVLILYAVAGAIAVSAVPVLAVHAAYRGLGFRAVAWVAGALIGAGIGLWLESVLTSYLPTQVRWWLPTLLGALVGAALGVAYGRAYWSS